jgi:hypothetical protein
MPLTPLSIAATSAVLLTTFAAPVHIVPATEEQSVSVRVSNFTTAAANVTLWMVPSGEALGNQHLRLKDFLLPAKDSKDVEVALALRPGAQLYIAASAGASIAAQVTGTRIVL